MRQLDLRDHKIGQLRYCDSISCIRTGESISSLKEEERTTLKAFQDGKDVSALPLVSFGKVR